MPTKMMMIFTKEEMKRCDFRPDGSMLVDLHEMTEPQAERFVNNIISLSRDPLHLVLIHGYHGGTVLRDMLRGKKFQNRCSRIFADASNEGRTHFLVA